METPKAPACLDLAQGGRPLADIRYATRLIG
jgi:hypothetical protein